MVANMVCKTKYRSRDLLSLSGLLPWGSGHAVNLLTEERRSNRHFHDGEPDGLPASLPPATGLRHRL